MSILTSFFSSDYKSKREYDLLLYKQEVHELRKGRRMSDFDHTLEKLRMKQRAQYKDHRPPPNQDHKADLNQDFWKESMDGSKINDDFLDKDDVLRTDSKHYKRFEKLVNDSRIFRILLLLFLSSGPLTMAIVSDR